MSLEASDRSWRDLLAEGRLPRFALICLGVWLNAADALVTATIMPSVGRDLGGYAYFGWATAGYFTGAILAGATAGRLSEIFSLRRATIAAALIYAAGCALSAAGPDIGLFLAGRLVQGLGAGWISGFSYVAIGLLLPERHLARAFAAIAGVWGLATLVGPLVGGLFAQAGAWRGVFWLFAIQAAGFGLAAAWLLPAAARGERAAGVPTRQVALIAAGVAAISVSGLGGGLLLAAGAGGLVLLWAAIRLDARSQVRLFPRQAGALSTPLGAGYAALFTMFAAGMGLSTYGPVVLQALRGLTPLEAGYVIGAEALGWTLAAFLVSGAGPPWPARWIRIGAVLLVAALAALALTVVDGPLTAVIVAASFAGAAYGVSWSFMSQAVLAHAPEAERGLASSSLGAVQQTGAAVGAALSGAVANLSGATADVFTATAARTVGLWVFVAALPPALLGVRFAWRLAAQAGPVIESSEAR